MWFKGVGVGDGWLDGWMDGPLFGPLHHTFIFHPPCFLSTIVGISVSGGEWSSIVLWVCGGECSCAPISLLSRLFGRRRGAAEALGEFGEAFGAGGA